VTARALVYGAPFNVPRLTFKELVDMVRNKIVAALVVVGLLFSSAAFASSSPLNAGVSAQKFEVNR
jgi:hypothetical protein